jgi:pimeloyl-ACP methyl ester carboxylesterase
VRRRLATRLASIAAATVAVTALVAGCSGEGDGAGAPPSPAAPPAGTPADLAAFYAQSLDWTGCGKPFECASARVPLDYADPGGRAITLRLVRLPAADHARRLGSLFVNPGGPGVSGLSYARTATTAISAEVRQRFDVVGFDPRGVGESTPVDCVDDAEVDTLLASEATPDTPAEEQRLRSDGKAYAADCQARSGELLGHVGTADVARDLDVLRAVVGDDRLTYLGKSYGTSIGATYAELFPTLVGRLVLDGVVDRTVVEPELSRRTALGFEKALTEFAQWCAAGDCPLPGGTQQVLDAVDEVLTSTDSDPLPTSSDRELTESLAFYGVLLPLYFPPDQGFPVLAQAVADGLDGDGTLLLALADAYVERKDDGSYDGNLTEANGAVNCLDSPKRMTLDEAAGYVDQFADAAPRFGPRMAWGMASCDGWPVAGTGSTEPVRAAGAAPILVVGNTGDTATPYSGAVSVAEQLESGRLLTWRATGHTAYRQGSDCIDAAVDAYLLEGTVPAAGTTCD